MPHVGRVVVLPERERVPRRDAGSLGREPRPRPVVRRSRTQARRPRRRPPSRRAGRASRRTVRGRRRRTARCGVSVVPCVTVTVAAPADTPAPQPKRQVRWQSRSAICDHGDGVVPVRQHRELVTADPGDEVAAEAAELGVQGPRDGLDELVAGEVAEGVVDLLEPVDVERDDRDRAPDAGCDVEGLGRALVEGAPVQQPGQRVAVGELLERLLAQRPARSRRRGSPSAPPCRTCRGCRSPARPGCGWRRTRPTAGRRR